MSYLKYAGIDTLQENMWRYRKSYRVFMFIEIIYKINRKTT